MVLNFPRPQSGGIGEPKRTIDEFKNRILVATMVSLTMVFWRESIAISGLPFLILGASDANLGRRQ